jgi:hypothetical protein
VSGSGYGAGMGLIPIGKIEHCVQIDWNEANMEVYLVAWGAFMNSRKA